MTILSSELRFFAAQQQTDDAYGGGLMSNVLVQDGVASNVFPVVSEVDRNIGRVQLRKVYAAVLSENTDELVGAAVNVYTPPSDGFYEFALFTWGDKRTTRAEAAAALAKFPFATYFNYSDAPVSGGVSGTGPTRTFGNVEALAVGSRVAVGFVTGGTFSLSRYAVVTAISGTDVTLETIFGTSAIGAESAWYLLSPAADAPKVFGATVLSAGVVASDIELPVERLDAQVVPGASPYPLSPQGIVSTALRRVDGRVPMFRANDAVLIRNLAGTVSEVAVIERVDHYNGSLFLFNGLSNAYSAGAIVTGLVPLGDLQARVGSSFSQQTWTRTFSDTLIGNPIGANYNVTAHPIMVINEGAETERWAIVFTNSTDFRLIGETLGQIAAGDITTDFLPINPITSQPYFTIAAAGWGTGWQAGNVLRFNTVGARAPFWAMRTTSPTPAASTDSALMQFRGEY